MKAGFFLFILFNMGHCCGNAQSLLLKADTLKFQYRFYGFKDSNTIYLSDFGSIERGFPTIVFQRIDYDKNTSLTSIEGLVDICCFEVLVASIRKKDELNNVRRFGETEEIPEATKQEIYTGRFSIKAKFEQNDVLLIGRPDSLYWGATLVPIGKIFTNR